MTSDRSTELFGEGWREPGDDCERLSYYIAFAVGTVFGFVMVGWGGWKLFDSPREVARLVGLLPW